MPPINPGDEVNAEINLTASDGTTMSLQGTMTVTEAPPTPEPIPPDPNPEPTPPGPNPEGSAEWIYPTSMIVSTLETGHVGHVYGWGGDAFGYGYAYSLEGAPGGVTIDRDTGRISIQNALSVGDKAFKVVVDDREDTELTARFDFTLQVKQGVTSNRTGDQILHKTYDVTSGAWGQASGNDWTNAIKAMRIAIINDQIAAGEGNHRAEIVWQRGKEYNYTWNRFHTGIQYFKSVAQGAGAPPIMKCTRNDPNDPYNSGPLGTESSTAMRYQGSIKSYCAKVNSTNVGDDTVTLKTAGDSSRLKVGRYHAVMSGAQQLGGYPPNVKHIDYVKVVSITGSTVKLDRKLKYAHKDDYWEDPNDWACFGKAYIVPWDMHPANSTDPMLPRLIQRGQFINLNFTPGSSDISYVESFVEMYFEGCTIPNPQFTMSNFVTTKDCSLHGGEPDKMTEQAVYDNCNNDAEMGGATGVQYFLIRGGNHRCMQVSPRQLRAIDTVIDAKQSTYLNVPFSTAYNGPCWEYEFDNVNFIADGSQATWTWGNPPVSPITLGNNSWVDDGSGSKNRLVIQRSFGPFQDWLTWAYEGLMIMKGTVQTPGDYGVITKISSPNDGSALWLDIKWIKGTKPTSGNLVIPQHGSRKMIWLNGTKISKGSWLDPSYMNQLGTPTERDFPAGIDEVV